MPYFYVNADKKSYKLTSIEKETGGVHYAIYAKRFEEHWRKTIFGKQLEGRDRFYTFRVPSDRKLVFRFDNETYSIKKADKMTVERLVNHLQTLMDLDQI